MGKQINRLDKAYRDRVPRDVREKILEQRPPHQKVSIDWEEVRKMAQAHVSGTTIAAKLGISNVTLSKRIKKEFGITWGDYMASMRAEGKDLIKMRQFQVAMAGDKSMLIWLGKQLLGQQDKVESTLKIPQIKLETIDQQSLEVIQNNLEALQEKNENNDDNSGDGEEEDL